MRRERGDRPDPAPRTPVQRSKAVQKLPPAGALAVGRAALLARRDVSRETVAALDAMVALLLEWQTKTNLVAPSTLPDLWSRHIEDSCLVFDVASEPRRWADLGSGAGFPGLILAILLKGRAGTHVDLIESNAKKAAFLRSVIRATGVTATVHAERIEACGDVLASVDAVSARALASLDTLLGFVHGRIRPEIPCYFSKGRHHGEEIVDASQHWRFTMVQHSSQVEDGSVLLELRDIQPV